MPLQMQQDKAQQKERAKKRAHTKEEAGKKARTSGEDQEVGGRGRGRVRGRGRGRGAPAASSGHGRVRSSSRKNKGRRDEQTLQNVDADPSDWSETPPVRDDEHAYEADVGDEEEEGEEVDDQ